MKMKGSIASSMPSLLVLALVLALAGCSRFGGVDSPIGPSEVRPKVLLDLSGSPQKIINNQFTISVYIENVTNLYYANIYIKYDPAKITFINGSEGSFLNQGGASTFFEAKEVENGIINVATTRSSPKSGASGTDVLCYLTFETKESTGGTGTSIQLLNEAPYDLGFRGIDESLNEYDVEATINNGITVYIQ